MAYDQISLPKHLLTSHSIIVEPLTELIADDEGHRLGIRNGGRL